MIDADSGCMLAPMHITVSAHELVEALNFNDESIFRFIIEMLQDERVGSDVAERLRNHLNEEALDAENCGG